MDKNYKKYLETEEFKKDKEEVEILFKEFNNKFEEIKNKYPLSSKKYFWVLSCFSDGKLKTQINSTWHPKYKINVRYGYDEMYPSEEHITNEYEDRYSLSQIGTFYYDNEDRLEFFADGIDNREDYKIELGEEFMVEHDIIVGLPVYIIITKLEE